LAEDSVTNMLHFLFELHAEERMAFSLLTSPPDSVLKLLEYFHIKHPIQYFEIQSAEIIIRALTRAGIVGLTNIGEFQQLPITADLIGLSCYDPQGPYMIRSPSTKTQTTGNIT